MFQTEKTKCVKKTEKRIGRRVLLEGKEEKKQQKEKTKHKERKKELNKKTTHSFSVLKSSEYSFTFLLQQNIENVLVNKLESFLKDLVESPTDAGTRKKVQKLQVVKNQLKDVFIKFSKIANS